MLPLARIKNRYNFTDSENLVFRKYGIMHSRLLQRPPFFCTFFKGEYMERWEGARLPMSVANMEDEEFQKETYFVMKQNWGAGSIRPLLITAMTHCLPSKSAFDSECPGSRMWGAWLWQWAPKVVYSNSWHCDGHSSISALGGHNEYQKLGKTCCHGANKICVCVYLFISLHWRGILSDWIIL